MGGGILGLGLGILGIRVVLKEALDVVSETEMDHRSCRDQSLDGGARLYLSGAAGFGGRMVPSTGASSDESVLGSSDLFRSAGSNSAGGFASRFGRADSEQGASADSGRSLEQFESLYSLIKNECPENQKLKVGILQKDKNEGPMVDEWGSFFSNKKLDYDIVDISSSISPILALKDSQEIVIIICDYIILFLETY